ncbi:MAG TPA: tetratricopeptide repeat protein, partial [Planctomycetaceae bacterium]
PLLLATPAANLRHQSPIVSLSRDGLSDQESASWQKAMNAGETQLRQNGYRPALAAFDQARAIDGGHALLAFRRAQCLEGLGRWEEALESYQAACDLDGYRIRAPSSFARIMTEVAELAQPGSLVRLLDTAALFAREAPHGILGNESFFEHVHFNYSGNWRLATILARHITREVLREPWQDALVPTAADRDDLCGVIAQDHLVANGVINAMIQREPFNRAADVGLQIQALQSENKRLFQEISPEEGAVVSSVSLAQLEPDIILALASNFKNAGMFREAESVLRCGVRRQPWRPDLLLGLADCEIRDGNVAQARVLLERARKWKPNRARLRELQQWVDSAEPP